MLVGSFSSAVNSAIYLNDQNISVSLGSTMAAEHFENRSTADSIASIIDAPLAEESENHNQSTHVWVSGGSLELDFDLGIEYDLKELHFWNYFGEGFDVDNIDFKFFDSSNSLVGSLLNVAPELGGGGSNPIFAQDYALTFPSKVQFVNAILTGSNNQVDFNNIGFTAEVSQAELIDFESVPGVGTPSEGLIISDQFETSNGITFALEGGGNPRIARIGSPATAFEGPDSDGVPNQAGDTPAQNQGIGTFFLTDDGVLSGITSQALLIIYSTPTSAASGVILDIDFDESFLIQALDEQSNVLQAIEIAAGDSGTGDGIATFWSFNRTSQDIASIRFAGTRTDSGSFGLGFDNFSARSVTLIPPSPIECVDGQVNPVLDIDGNCKVDALTDGLLTIRYMFGLVGNALIDGAISPDCTRCNSNEISLYLDILSR